MNGRSRQRDGDRMMLSHGRPDSGYDERLLSVDSLPALWLTFHLAPYMIADRQMSA